MARKRVKSAQDKSKTSPTTHVLPITIIILITFITGLYYWITYTSFIGYNQNSSIFLPLTLKFIDPELYTNDIEINAVYKYYPKTVLFLWAYIYSNFNDFKPVLAIIYLTLTMILLSGIYSLAYTITKSKFSSILAVLLSIPIRNGLCNEKIWGLESFADNPFTTSLCIPFIPWSILFFIKAYNKRATLSILFLLLSLLLYIQPIIPLHLMLLLSISTLFIDKKITLWIKRLYLPIFIFTIASSPLIYKYYKILSSIQNNHDIKPYPDQIITNDFLFDILPLLIIALFTCIDYPKDEISKYEKKTILILIIAIISATGVFFAKYSPTIAMMQTQKMSIYFYLLPIIFIAHYLGYKFKTRKNIKKFLPSIIILTILFPGTYIQPIKIFTLDQKEITKSIKNEKIYKIQPQEIDDFLNLCKFCKKNTPKNAIFITPPKDYASFRFYAQRSIIASYETDLFLPLHQRADEKRAQTLKKIDNFYKSSLDIKILDKEYIDNRYYVVVNKKLLPDNKKELEGYTLVFSNNHFMLLRLK